VSGFGAPLSWSNLVSCCPHISLRLDQATQIALRAITEIDGTDRSSFVRNLITSAVKQRFTQLGSLAFEGSAVGVDAPASRPRE
jgi:hypothetical protein